MKENVETSETKTIEDAIKYLRDTAQKRNFVQTFDLIINLKNIDTKKDNISREIVLPCGRGKDVKVGIFSDTIPEAVTTKSLNDTAANPKLARKLVRDYDFFVASAPMMLVVGKTIGRYLAPSGKMPKPMPPNVDHKSFMERAKKTVRLRTVKQLSMKCPIGTEKMSDTDIATNVRTVIADVEKALPKGRTQIKNVLLKLSMGKPTKIVMK